MKKFLTIQKPDPTEAERVALELLESAESEFQERMGRHTVDFRKFWNTKGTTPDEILAGMGMAAAQWLAGAKENVESMARLAALTGAALTDYWPAEDFMPPRKFVFETDDNGNFTGRVTLEPLPEPEPLTEQTEPEPAAPDA